MAKHICSLYYCNLDHLGGLQPQKPPPLDLPMGNFIVQIATLFEKLMDQSQYRDIHFQALSHPQAS